MLDKLYERRNLIIALSIVGLLIMIGGGIGLWIVSRPLFITSSQPTPLPTLPPDLELALPPSLDELVEQYPDLETVLRDSELGSVYKDFLVAYESGGNEAAEALARQRGILNDSDEIIMTIVVDEPEDRLAVVEELEAFRITVTAHARNEINIAIKLAVLETLAEQVEAQGPQQFFEQLISIEHVVSVKLPVLAQKRRRLRQQSVVGEGIEVAGAEIWHQAGYTGAGIKVAILDLGFAGYREFLGVELPADVTAKSFVFNVPDIADIDEVHGTACAEIVHEMAPGAELLLVATDGSTASLEQAVTWLLEQQVDIISYSVGSYLGPKDGTSWEAELVNWAASEGVLWVNASGNGALSHYRGEYTDIDGDNQHEFPDGEELMAVYAVDKFQVILQWDDWETADQDYDLHLYDAGFNLLASSKEPQASGAAHYPVEFLSYLGSADWELYYVAVESISQSRHAIFDLFIENGEVNYATAEHSLNVPADAAGALAVGATEWRDDSLAVYSSQGPTDDGRIKPDISAPTTVSGASYGPEGFPGTSASAPHVAGAAALIWSKNPELSRQKVIGLLQNNAVDLGPNGPDIHYGSGRLNMPGVDMVEDIAAAPTDVATATAASNEEPTEVVAALPQATEQPGLSVVPTVPTVVPTQGLPAFSDPETESPAAPLAPFLAACLLGLMCCGGTFYVGGLGGLFLRSRRRQSADSPTHQVSQSEWSITMDGQRYKLSTAGLTIGRASENDIVILDRSSSRQHARIFSSDGRWFVEDLDSTNGTKVNGESITRRELAEGDMITIESKTLLYRS